ncbi:initiator tRNA phosphoribosyl transferase-domain-containing protein [Phaeosphaeriaceae sp. PMI808]|nr:initiator tRNA phosphoribosyl transferase-domain-containing protein [Phaeosphaeriaceae sp. PMI808]
MSQPLSEADILFPHQFNTPKLSTTLTSLKRSTLSVHNRLGSIISDSKFVSTVAESYQLPLVANERCGSWYIPPEKKKEGVYFKSTDGHMSQWGFSLRRLNLQLLDVVQELGGAVIVDSTRRGKSMPDALSKTIPIWCCVMNRAIFGAGGMHALYTPPQAVSESEHAQIDVKIDGFVRDFIDTCKPNTLDLRAKLLKPLRPIWVTQQSYLPATPPSFPDFHAIVLCTASRRVHGAEASEGGYIQGGADDHEAWSHKLTPAVFWKHKDVLMNTSEEDSPTLIAELLKEEEKNNSSTVTTLIKPTNQLYISSSQNIDIAGFDAIISCTSERIPSATFKDAKVPKYLALKCQSGKLGSRDLRNELPLLLPFLSSLTSTTPPARILVCCPTGNDLSVGIALAILCLYANDAGQINLATPKPPSAIDKKLIKQRLSWITTSNPSLNPSRATLQSVNAVLLTSHDPKSTNMPSPAKQADSSTCPGDAVPDDEDNTKLSAHIPSSPPCVPLAIFTALASASPWSFHRTLTSTLPTHPSGTVVGTAGFTRCGVPEGPATLLYAEEGDFVTATGMRFTARRKYVYQLHVSSDGGGKPYIGVKFFDDEKMPRAGVEDGVGARGEGVGGVFVGMDELEEDGKGYVARNKETHLCAEDLYTASWAFSSSMAGQGDGGMWWEVRVSSRSI